MKITKKYLQEIIKEELRSVLLERGFLLSQKKIEKLLKILEASGRGAARRALKLMLKRAGPQAKGLYYQSWKYFEQLDRYREALARYKAKTIEKQGMFNTGHRAYAV